ncbi:MAG: ABC transporter permease [Desulfovibrionaceae bacterium]
MKNFFYKIQSSQFVRSFFKDKLVFFSFLLFFFLFLCAFLSPIIAPHTPHDLGTLDILDSNLPPSWEEGGEKQFLLGTDQQGRDILSAVLYGLRLSLIIGFFAVSLQILLGIFLGLLAGYNEGWIDSLIMRIADIKLSFSTYIVAIFAGALVQSLFGVEYYNEIAMPMLIFIIGFSEWPQYARTIRSKVLSEKKKEYVEAAQVIGLSSIKIMWKHILPNSLTPIIVISTVQIASAIMSEAALSFLGLGMPSTKPSLGSLIKEGFHYFFSGSWWIILFPSITLVCIVLSINILGDWMREYLNPKSHKE